MPPHAVTGTRFPVSDLGDVFGGGCRDLGRGLQGEVAGGQVVGHAVRLQLRLEELSVNGTNWTDARVGFGDPEYAGFGVIVMLPLLL